MVLRNEICLPFKKISNRILDRKLSDHNFEARFGMLITGDLCFILGRILIDGYLLLVLDQSNGSLLQAFDMESKINYFNNPDVQVDSKRKSFFFVGHEGIEEISVKFLCK